jgi:hypothetical protein
MSWVSSFVRGVKKAIKDPLTILTAAVYALSGNYAMAAVTIASSGAANALAPSPQAPTAAQYSDYTSEALNRTQMIKQPIVPRRFVYGETRISGVLGHIESTGSDEYLHLVILVASHEIDSFQTIYLNDEALTFDGSGNVTSPSRFNGKVRVKLHTGSATQTADSSLVSESAVWTSSHRLQGIAYMYIRLRFDNDVFPTGIPNFSAKVRGKKLYDPRTATTAYSANPALAIRDYLTDSFYGLGCDATEINDTDIIAAANTCEQTLYLSGGGSEKRYEIHGTLATNNAPKRILEEMVTSCGGVVSYVNGKFTLKVSEYRSPTIVLDEDDITSPISIQTKRSKRDNYNAVKGVFSPPSTNYVPTDYPALTSSTFETEDGGLRKFLEYNLPYTTSHTMAQRLSRIALYRNRQQVTMSATFTMKAFDLSVGDSVQITNSRLGFSQKVFEVAEWSFSVSDDDNGMPIIIVALFLRETNPIVYSWANVYEQAFTLDNTNLPDPFNVPAPTITPSDTLELFNQQAISVLVVDVASTSIYAEQFEVEAKLSTETIYKSLGIAAGQRFTLVNVKAGGTYNIRARSISSLGVKSAFATANHTIVGQAATASDVTNFSVNVVGSNADLSWTASIDQDLSHYVIRHSPLTIGATFNNAQTVVKKVPRPTNTVMTPAKTGTYFLKAVNKFGGQSVNAASSVVLVDDVSGLNLANSLSEHTDFTGTKTTCVVVDDTLRLDTTNLFDSVAGNFDDATGLFGGGTGFVASSGTYDFANYIDLGAVFTAQATATLKFTQFSQHTGTPASGATDVDLFVSTTQDDPAGSPSWTAYRQFVVGTYTARALRFRANLTTIDSQETPAISELTAEIRLPTRTESDNDIQSGTGGKAITFTNAFKALRAVSVSVGDMQSGDYYGITSKSATGFTITFYNSSNVAVDRLFDYVATGF